jgi:hypothetical protein
MLTMASPVLALQQEWQRLAGESCRQLSGTRLCYTNTTYGTAGNTGAIVVQTYKPMGKLVGRFFTPQGNPTEELLRIEEVRQPWTPLLMG